MGTGTDQKGFTGALTEFADKYIDLFLVIMCEILNVGMDQADEMRKIMKSNKQVDRDRRLVLRPEMLQAAMDELGIPGEATKLAKGHGGTGKAEFTNQVKHVFLRAFWDQIGPADRQQVKDMVKDFHDGQQVRKAKSHLGFDGNKRFQQLIAKGRDDEAGMSEAEWLELLKLNLKRFGWSDEKAEEAAEEILTNPDPEALKKMKLDDTVVKHFLRGGSATANI